MSLRSSGAVKGSDCEGGTEKRRIALTEWAWIALRILGDGEGGREFSDFLDAGDVFVEMYQCSDLGLPRKQSSHVQRAS